ncbi:hypothetical protein F4779DRAFT_571445 [Xylariaceae sp. FL0662B]|nr:hypothetical protein F4779DRAFT_571445 [Xylariaceae sp. FL0662B]
MAATPGAQIVKLPGFGLPVQEMPSPPASPDEGNWYGVDMDDNIQAEDSQASLRFPHAMADGCSSSGVTLNERRMLAFMSELTDKPNWDDNVFNEEIVEQWRQEAPNQGGYFGKKMFEYCIQELREKAIRHKETGMVAVLDTEATVVKSDTAIPPELRDAFRAAVAPLENMLDRPKDRHPCSDDEVLELVDPSLYPLVYGTTKVLASGKVPLDTCVKYSGTGELTNSFDDSEEDFWDRYQWLPTDVHFVEGGNIRISTYINNLHPVQHQDLYGVLEKIIAQVVPFWDESLSWFQNRIRINIEHTSNEDWVPPEKGKSKEWTALDDGDNDETNDRKHVNLYEYWWLRARPIKQPEPDVYTPFSETTNRPGARPIDLREEFRDSGLQVIFKLTNIHLDPSKPYYEGGTWRVEGALNEHICATAIYYYDEENITESHLSFRQSIREKDMRLKPVQFEFESCQEYYGIQNEAKGTLIQVLGPVLARQDRLVVFPNVLQHCVYPFSLADATKPGHRKVLAIFLVDPHIRVLSTANVPPQRRDWWADEVGKINPFVGLPVELFDHIISFVDYPWGMEEAKRVREELVGQREWMDEHMNDQIDDAYVDFFERDQLHDMYDYDSEEDWWLDNPFDEMDER